MGGSLGELRLELAARSKWNIGFFWSGFIYWSAAAVVGWVFPLETARLLWLLGTGLIFPLALLASRLLRADPFSTANPIGAVVGYTHMSVIFMTLPLVVIAWAYYPEFMILVLAVSTSLSYYVMSWAFGSPLFILHAVLRTVAVVAAWVAFPGARPWLVPLLVAVAYGITLVLIPVLRGRSLQGASAAGSRP